MWGQSSIGSSTASEKQERISTTRNGESTIHSSSDVPQTNLKRDVVTLNQNKVWTWEDFVNYITENEDEFENAQWAESLEEYHALTTSPININNASKTELLQIPLLSDRQASDICEYVAKHEGMKSIYELAFIPSISYAIRQFIPLFAYIGPITDGKERTTLKDMFKHAKHELLSRVDIPLYVREGYRRENGFRGSSLYNKTKYSFESTKHLTASFHLERDGGERGIDSYGGQIMLKEIGNLTTFVIGDYRASFGEGLIINNGFSLGKSSQLAPTRPGFRAQTGTDEINFLRGAAASFNWNHLSASVFFSRKNMDATLQGDSCVKTVLKTGYHRTDSEWNRRSNLTFTTTGANLAWQNKEWHIGATGIFLNSSLPFIQGKELYQKIAPKGKRFFNASVDYKYESYRWKVHGETAFSPTSGGVATLNTINWMASQNYTFSITQRYYDKKYYSFFARSLSENTNVQNENGVTLRMNATPVDGLEVSTYFDYFNNPWPKYGVKHSTSGFDWVVTTNYQPNQNNLLSIRYNIKSKENTTGQLLKNRIRAQWKSNISEHFTLNTTAMLNICKGNESAYSLGKSISEQATYFKNGKNPFTITLAGTYFHTDDTNTQIYAYEPNVEQQLYMQSLNGHGIRLAGKLKWRLLQNRIIAEIKYGLTHFLDGRKTQSSGLETIYGNTKNDITIQIRMKL